MRFSWISCFLVVVTACGNDSASDPHSVDDAGADAAPVSDAECTAQVSLLDYKLSPSKLELMSGRNVLCTRNDGKAPHDLALRDAANDVLGRTPKLGPGEHAQFEVELEAGTYVMFCTQAGHESLGMTGPVSVE
jgi:uncharacterized cupredoxin-like copper-binding protein